MKDEEEYDDEKLEELYEMEEKQNKGIPFNDCEFSCSDEWMKEVQKQIKGHSYVVYHGDCGDHFEFFNLLHFCAGNTVEPYHTYEYTKEIFGIETKFITYSYDTESG